MIPRKDPGYYPARPGEPPVQFALKSDEPALFTPRFAPLRKIVVMIDSGLLSGSEIEDDPSRRLLHWQLGNVNVRYYSYPGCMDYLRHRNGRSLISYAQVLGTEIDDHRASLTAGMLGVDFYITEGEQLLRDQRWLNAVNSHYPPPEPPCHNSEEAAAILGLYLRAQGDFSLPWDGETSAGPGARARFYRIGALSVAPALCDWSTLGRYSGDDPFLNKIKGFMATVVERLGRALAQRDQMHIALRRVDDPSGHDEVFARFEFCLQLLMSALDCCARVTYLTLAERPGSDLNAATHNVAWHRGKLPEALERDCPALHGLVAEGTRGARIMVVLRLLRNTIHGESIRVTGGQSVLSWGEFHPLLKLTAEPEGQFRRAITGLEADDDWRLPEQGGLVHPGELLEQVFPRVVKLIDELVKSIPVGEHRAVPEALARAKELEYKYPAYCCLHLGIAPRLPPDGLITF